MNPHSRTLLVTLLLCLAAALVGCPVTGGGIRIASDDPPVNSPARETIVAADGRSYTVVERRADGTIEIADGETHGGRNHGLLAADGTVIVPAEHGTIMELHDGTAWVLDEKWGKVDQTGKVVVPFRYDYINAAYPGLMLAWLDRTDPTAHLIRGTTVIEGCDSTTAVPFVGGMLVTTRKDTSRMLIGTPLGTMKYCNVDDLDSYTKRTVDRVTVLEAPENALPWIVRPDDHSGWGALGPDGASWLIKPEFISVANFGNGLLVAFGTNEHNGGVFRRDGSVIVPTTCSDVKMFSRHEFVACNVSPREEDTPAYCIVGRDGRMIAEARYLDVQQSLPGLIAVQGADGWGVLKLDGSTLLPATCKSVSTAGDLLKIEGPDGFGLLSADGSFRTEVIWQADSFVQRGTRWDVCAQVDGSPQLLDQHGKRLFPGSASVSRQDDWLAVTYVSDGRRKTGLYTADELAPVLQPVYGSAQPFGETGLFIVPTSNGTHGASKWALVTGDARVLIEQPGTQPAVLFAPLLDGLLASIDSCHDVDMAIGYALHLADTLSVVAQFPGAPADRWSARVVRALYQAHGADAVARLLFAQDDTPRATPDLPRGNALDAAARAAINAAWLERFRPEECQRRFARRFWQADMPHERVTLFCRFESELAIHPGPDPPDQPTRKQRVLDVARLMLHGFNVMAAYDLAIRSRMLEPEEVRALCTPEVASGIREVARKVLARGNGPATSREQTGSYWNADECNQLSRAGDWSGAAIGLKEGLELGALKRNSPALRMLATARFYSGDLAGAVDAMKELQALGDLDVELLVMQAVLREREWHAAKPGARDALRDAANAALDLSVDKKGPGSAQHTLRREWLSSALDRLMRLHDFSKARSLADWWSGDDEWRALVLDARIALGSSDPDDEEYDESEDASQILERANENLFLALKWAPDADLGAVIAAFARVVGGYPVLTPPDTPETTSLNRVRRKTGRIDQAAWGFRVHYATQDWRPVGSDNDNRVELLRIRSDHSTGGFRIAADRGNRLTTFGATELEGALEEPRQLPGFKLIGSGVDTWHGCPSGWAEFSYTDPDQAGDIGNRMGRMRWIVGRHGLIMLALLDTAGRWSTARSEFDELMKRLELSD